MAEYTFHNLLVSVDDRVATVTLNRPHALNAVTHEMHDELEACFHALAKDRGVAAVIVTGAGRGFCGGFDIKTPSPRPDSFLSMLPEEVGKVTRAILSTPQPIIAAVNGPAVGQGVNIALYCDVVIASDRARFGDVHVKAGVAPGDGGAAIFPLLVGLNRAKELLMTGGIVEAQEAHRIGLAQRLVPHDRLMEEAQSLARRLAHGPQLAIRWTKQALNQLAWERVTRTLHYTAALELLSGKHPDGDEARQAFAEKRDPRYTPRLEG